MQDILMIKDLHVAFDDLEVVRGVDFHIKKGEIHGILGESGSGKTVTAYSIAKLHETATYKGDIMYNGEAILEMNENKLSTLRGDDIAYIFQNPHESFNPNKKLGKQLKEAMAVHGLQPSEEDIIKILETVGLKDPSLVLKKYPDQLSGGECQRVMIGMSLLCEPQIIVADEPTSAIDASIKMQIIDVLKEINKTYGTTIIIISHDIDLVENICDSMSIMYGGLVMEQGLIQTIKDDPKHPYTKALMACTASLNQNNGKLVTLPGLPMSPQHYTDYCPFYDRCDIRGIECKDTMPELIHYNNRSHRCFNV